MEVRNIVQEAMTKTIPKKKKHNKAKWLSEEALQIAVKRREAKAKEKEKDIPNWMQSSREGQREIRKHSQWSVQRNRGKQWMGKSRHLFKKIRDTKETFHTHTQPHANNISYSLIFFWITGIRKNLSFLPFWKQIYLCIDMDTNTSFVYI